MGSTLGPLFWETTIFVGEVQKAGSGKFQLLPFCLHRCWFNISLDTVPLGTTVQANKRCCPMPYDSPDMTVNIGKQSQTMIRQTREHSSTKGKAKQTRATKG